MKIVIDTNILISALIKDSIKRKVVVESGWKFYYPEISLHEIRKHRGLILRKSGLNEDEYLQILNRLMKYVILVPEEQIRPKLEEENKLLGNIDPADVVFLATALSIDSSILWSDDKDFDRQNTVRNLKTKEILTLLSSE